MSGLSIWGESDDLVELEGVTDLAAACEACGRGADERPTRGVIGKGSEEIGCYDEDVVITVGDDDRGTIVRMHYGLLGCWSAEVSVIAEWVPAYDVSVASIGHHTVTATVDAPDGTPVKWETVPVEVPR